MKKFSILILSLFFATPLAFADASPQEICEINGINYQQATSFVTNVQAVIKADNKTTLADMMSYPVRINKEMKGKNTASYIKNKDDLIKQYDAIFTKKTKEGLTSKDIFCNSQGASIGAGVIWFTQTDAGAKIFSINTAQ